MINLSFNSSGPLEPEYGGSISRKRIGEGIRLAVTLSFGGFKYLLLFTALIKAVLIVQEQSEVAPLRNTDPVIFAGDRGEVTDKEQIFLFRLVTADKAENASFGIVGIDPFKSGKVAVQAVKCRIFPVEGEEAADVFL